MVTRDTAWPAGTPCWVDLGVDDIGQAKAFYGGLFGWDIQDGPPEAGGYTMCLLQRQAGGGHRPQGRPGRGAAHLDHLPRVRRRGRHRGPDQGGRRHGADGAVRRAWTWAGWRSPPTRAARCSASGRPGSHTGIGVANEPGSLTWNENMSRNFDGNKAFYQAVFGYTFGDLSSEGFRYATLDLGRAAGRRHRRARPRLPGRGPAELGRLLRRRRLGRGRGPGRRARRHRGPARVGHPVRADGRAQRRPGRDVLGGQRRGSQRRLTRLASRAPGGLGRGHPDLRAGGHHPVGRPLRGFPRPAAGRDQADGQDRHAAAGDDPPAHAAGRR